MNDTNRFNSKNNLKVSSRNNLVSEANVSIKRTNFKDPSIIKTNYDNESLKNTQYNWNTKNSNYETDRIKENDKIINNLRRMQEKMLSKIKKSNKKYLDLMSKIKNDVKIIKKRTNIVKVENGKTVQEYLHYRKKENKQDKVKRIDCLNLLNTYGHSTQNKDYMVNFYFQDYPRKYRNCYGYLPKINNIYTN